MLNNPVKYIDPSGHAVCDEFGFCFDHGRLINGTPEDFFLKVLFSNPIHDLDQSKPRGMGQERGGEYTYCLPNDPKTCADSKYYHPGVDIGNTMGTPVYAAAPGKVVFAGWTVDYGFTIIVETVVLGESFYTIYGHLGNQSHAGETNPTPEQSGIFVHPGDQVYGNTQIGLLGNSKGLPGQKPIEAHLH